MEKRDDDKGQKDAGTKGTEGKDSSQRDLDDKAAIEGQNAADAPLQHHMAKELEENPPAPSNPDSWQGNELASIVRESEGAPPEARALAGGPQDDVPPKKRPVPNDETREEKATREKADADDAAKFEAKQAAKRKAAKEEAHRKELEPEEAVPTSRRR